MNLKNLIINNFKCFNNSNVSFNNLTVLAGTNAVGKSTVIQALLLLRQTIERIKQFHILYESEKINFGGKYLKIKLNKSFELSLGNSKIITSASSDSEKIEFVIKFNIEELSFKYISSRKNPDQFVYYIIERKTLNTISKYDPIFKLFSDYFYYLIAERNGPRESQKISDFDFDHTGYRGEFTGYVLVKNGSNFSVDKKRCINNDIFLLKKQVEYWMDLIVPGTEIDPEIFENINTTRIGIRKRSCGTDYLNPPNIGFGISYSLPIIVNGLIANKNSIYIVENPEAHLHPAAQSKIGFFLAKIASSGLQVIIETHSEHIINGIRLAVLKKEINNENITINFFSQKERSEIINIDEINVYKNSDLSHWPKGFFDQQERDLSEIFKSRRNAK